MTLESIVEMRDKATQIALNFAGQRISSSDGSYELLIEMIQHELIESAEAAQKEQAATTAKAERMECAKIVHEEYLSYTEGGYTASQCLADAEKRILARCNQDDG